MTQLGSAADRWNDAIKVVAQQIIEGRRQDVSEEQPMRITLSEQIMDALNEAISAGQDLRGLLGHIPNRDRMYEVVCGNCATEFTYELNEGEQLPEVSLCSRDCRTDYQRRVRNTDVEPEVGMPCTMSILGDSHPGEILQVSPSRHQFWYCDIEHLNNAPHGVGCPRKLATRREDGRYRPVGAGTGCSMTVGSATYRRDPHV